MHAQGSALHIDALSVSTLTAVTVSLTYFKGRKKNSIILTKKLYKHLVNLTHLLHWRILVRKAQKTPKSVKALV